MLEGQQKGHSGVYWNERGVAGRLNSRLNSVFLTLLPHFGITCGGRFFRKYL